MSSSTSKNTNSITISNILVVVCSVLAVRVFQLISSTASDKNDHSNGYYAIKRGNSLSHFLHPHPLNLTWHLNGPQTDVPNSTSTGNDSSKEQMSASTNQAQKSLSPSSSSSSSSNQHVNEKQNNSKDEQNHQNGSPLVTMHDILPLKMVSKIVKELKSSTQVVRHPNGQMEHQCILRRDGLPCGNERWIDFNADSFLSSFNAEDGNDGNDGNDGKYGSDAAPRDLTLSPRDIFEQAVIEIAKHDVTKVLKRHIAKHVIGVSWRILVTESGQISSIFHYDTDEDTEYVIPSTPLIYPLLSTVTYLSNAGEPTLILEHTQLISPASSTLTKQNLHNKYQILYPQNAYISMPKTNKHLAFDSRLFHGSAVPLSKNKGKYRLVIGMNFHTHQSFESKNEDSGSKLHLDQIIPPLALDHSHDEPVEVGEGKIEGVGESSKSHHNVKEKSINNNNSQTIKANPTVQPYNKKSIIDRPSHYGWEKFDLFRTESHGYDFCLRPCFLTLQLPLSQILKYDEKHPGATLGFRLREEDFHISTTGHVDDIIVPPQKQMSKDAIREARLVASEMLNKRCEIYNNDMYEMSPPLNQCEY